MAPPETPEELAHRFEREQRALQLQREDRLMQSLQGFRVGSVCYLNGAPLVRGIEDQILLAPPAELARLLREDKLDAALVSVAEVLLTGRYDVLDGIAVASLGEVQSVLLAHREPLEAIKVIHCDPASISGMNLLKVLLAEKGLHPEFKPLPSYDVASMPDNTLLIGDRALDFLLGPHEHQIWDLGSAWFELTGLPFVFAVWALRRGIDNEVLKQQLREAKAFGLETLDNIIATNTQYTLDFRKDYLTWHIHYHLGSDEKRGMAKFIELLRKHGFGPVHEPKFVA